MRKSIAYRTYVRYNKSIVALRRAAIALLSLKGWGLHMSSRKKIPDNQITVYQTNDGRINIEVLYANENIWLPQKRIAELFDCTADNISLHLKNIYKEKELDEKSTAEEFSVVQIEGTRKVTRNITCYSLEAIIAVGYRVNSERGTQFRQWAITILQQYIHKGFAIDSDRFTFCYNRSDCRRDNIKESRQYQAQYGADFMAQGSGRENHAS